MFYKKKYERAVDTAGAWRNLYFKSESEKKDYKETCDWLVEKYEKLRKRDAFTFDKAEFKRLKLENAELKAEVEKLRKGAKK